MSYAHLPSGWRPEVELPPREDLMTLSQARDILPTGRGGARRSTSTLWRWASKGIRGRKLRVIKIGRVAHTTRRWLFEFFQDLADYMPANLLDSKQAHPTRDSRSLRDAEEELDGLGITGGL